MPLAADTYGGFGTEADLALRKVVKHARLFQGESAITATQLRQKLQLAVMRGLARQLLRRQMRYDLHDDCLSHTHH